MAPKCYRGTEYFFIIQNLLSKAKNSEIQEKCPKCAITIKSYYDLLIHIEKFHSSDVKHKPFLNQTSQEHEETFSQNSNSLETPNDNPEMIIEDFQMLKANDPLTDSSTLDGLKDNPFFEVILNLL